MKVVINTCYGGFGLSPAAILRCAELKGITVYADDTGHFGSLPTSYYTIPVEEYRRLEAEEAKQPVSPGRYARTNAAYFNPGSWDRNDPTLIAVIEELGDKANGGHAKLKIVEIPDDVSWQIEEYDGCEHIAEVHRTWS